MCGAIILLDLGFTSTLGWCIFLFMIRVFLTISFCIFLGIVPSFWTSLVSTTSHGWASNFSFRYEASEIIFVSSSEPHQSYSILGYESSEILVIASSRSSLVIPIISSLNSMRFMIEAWERALIPSFGLTVNSIVVLVSASSNKASLLTWLCVSYTSNSLLPVIYTRKKFIISQSFITRHLFILHTFFSIRYFEVIHIWVPWEDERNSRSIVEVFSKCFFR